MADPKATLANWRTAPHNRWAFHHVRELVPSADIPNDPRRIRELEHRPADFSGLRIDPDAGEPLSLERFLQETDTDGFLILHRGRLVFEYYGNGMTDQAPHILMSVSKSMLGLLFDALGVDAGQPAAAFIPQLEATAYRDATLRHLLDMRAAIAFDEDYLATAGPIIEYRKATGWNPLGPGESPSDLHSFYATLKETDGKHGGRFHYVSPNTDLLGWVIEEATGRRFAELMSELVWKPAGAERSAYVTVDRLGAPRCAGGMCATLRDLARVGQWMMETQAGFLEDLETHGDPQAWAAGDLVAYYPRLPMRYRNHWYVLDGEAPLAFGMGIHGQNLFVDRLNGIVIAKLSSQALPLDAARMALTMQAVSRMRAYLAHR
ncbi:MAG TPA: serine hydrolase [Burkholderiales bacterium]|nr:serine hydrolase [Burkholderiales bacterium]